jgi:hypothetical protein
MFGPGAMVLKLSGIGAPSMIKVSARVLPNSAAPSDVAKSNSRGTSDILISLPVQSVSYLIATPIRLAAIHVLGSDLAIATCSITTNATLIVI